MESVHVDPAEVGARAAYSILLNCVAPRPIAFVSTLSPEGLPNLAPFSFFTAGGANPPSVVFSPTARRNGDEKDTLVNIEATGEYVINVVTYSMREGMNATSPEYPHGESEWGKAGFTPAESLHIRPPRVLQSPLSMECRLFKILQHGSGAMAASYVIGEVVGFHIAADLLVNDVIDPSRVDYIARMSGDWYARVQPDCMFEMGRPGV